MTIGADDVAPTRRNRYARKTRAFQCTLLRGVVWTTYRNDKRWMRPIFLDFCGTESQHRAFVANLRCGRVALLSGNSSKEDGYELLRSEEYRYAPPVRCDEGVRQVVYFPQLFDVDVKGQGEWIFCVAMPPTALLSSITVEELGATRAALRVLNEGVETVRQQIMAENLAVESWRRRSLPEPLELDDAEIAEWALVARELTVRVDSRTRYPVPPAPEFRALLLVALLREGHAELVDNHWMRKLSGGKRSMSSWRQGLLVRGATDYRTTEDAGYLQPVAVAIEQVKLGELLARLAREYFERKT